MKRIDIERNTLIKYIESGKLKKEVCKDLGISMTTLRKIVKRNNLVFPTRSWKKGLSFVKNYSFLTKDWFNKNWLTTNKSLQVLSEEFNIPLSTLEYRVSSIGINKKYKYSVDSDKLFNLSDPNVYYLAGLIATDGYLSKGRNSVEISLTGESELELLKDIKLYFNVGAPINPYGISHRIRICTDGLNKFFNDNFNIPDGPKTFCVGIPTHFPSECHAKSYILGCFDGDGYISNSKGNKVSLLTASEKFVRGIKDIIEKYSGVNMWFGTIKKNNNEYYSISADYKKARRFLNWLYSDIQCMYLKRKRPMVDDIV